MNQEQKLECWAAKEITKQFHNIIIDNNQGHVLAFGRWEIIPRQGCVTVQDQHERREFSSRRSAISWCVAQKYRQYHLAQAIEQHDADRLRMLTDITQQQQLANRSQDWNYKQRVLTKTQGQKYRLQHVERELKKYTTQAKYLQLRGFTK
jgi:hypothetical protein